MAEAVNAAAEERLAAVRAQLVRAREANLLAVAAETSSSAPLRRSGGADPGDRPSVGCGSGGDNDSGTEGERGARRKRTRKRRRAEREVGDVVSNALARRVNRARRADRTGPGGALSRTAPEAEVAHVVSYGGAGRLQPGAADLVAKELADAEERRVRALKDTGRDDEAEDIDFINDQNKRFNKVVDNMYGKHEAVKEIKDNLERGTALN